MSRDPYPRSGELAVRSCNPSGSSAMWRWCSSSSRWCCSASGSCADSTRSGTSRPRSRPGRRSRRPTCRRCVPAGAAVGDAAVEAVEHRSVTATRHLRRRRHLRGGEPHLQRRVRRMGAHAARARRRVRRRREPWLPRVRPRRRDRSAAGAARARWSSTGCSSRASSAGGSGHPTPTRARSRCWRASTWSGWPSRWTTTCCPAYVQLVSSDARGGAPRRRCPGARAARPPGAVRGAAPRIRRAVVHLHDHRGGRLRRCSSAGWRATRPARRRDGGRRRLDRELEELLDAEA